MDLLTFLLGSGGSLPDSEQNDPGGRELSHGRVECWRELDSELVDKCSESGRLPESAN